MVYCTVDQIMQEFSQIAGWANNAQLEQAIGLVSADIDSYLVSGGYVLPLAENTAVLTQKCIDMVAWKVLSAKGVMPGSIDTGADPIRVRAKDAVRWLEMVAKGSLKLAISEGASTDASTRMGRGMAQVAAAAKLDLSGFV